MKEQMKEEEEKLECVMLSLFGEILVNWTSKPLPLQSSIFGGFVENADA